MEPKENGMHKDEILDDVELGRNSLSESGQPNDPNGFDRSSSHFSSQRRSQRQATTDQPLPFDAASDQSIPFYRKISWELMIRYFKKWIRSPANIAIFIWIVFVVVGLIIDALVMFGALDSVISDSDRRKKWNEVINQILNALFMIMCLYQHPVLFHHLTLLLRWKPKDQVKVRKVYCKGGVRKPNDRDHMLFVVILLHITCAAQYIMCGFFWAYNRHNRPNSVVYSCVVVGTVAPVIAFIYTLKSPLGRKYDNETELGQVSHQSDQTVRREQSVRNRGVLVAEPEWNGGLFDFCDDPTVFCWSFLCTFGVFGWNMERLGFGNMYVHMFTFLLLCVAPIVVFGVTAIKIDDVSVGDDGIGVIVVISGGVLCVLGLLYGGVWRSEMRKKFKLPGDTLCCGYAWATDFVKWLFCWSCSLAQEVRTANFYDIGDDGFYRGADEDVRSVMVPLPREGELGPLNSSSTHQQSASASASAPASASASASASPKIEPLDPLKPPAQVSVDMISSYDQVFPFGPLDPLKAPAQISVNMINSSDQVFPFGNLSIWESINISRVHEMRQ